MTSRDSTPLPDAGTTPDDSTPSDNGSVGDALYPAGTPTISADTLSPFYRPDAIDYGNPDLSTICLQLIRNIRANADILGLDSRHPSDPNTEFDNSYGVYYGTDSTVGLTYLPIIFVEGIGTESDMEGISSRITNGFTVMILLCHGDLTDSSSQVKWESLRRAELLRDVLHQDLQLRYTDPNTGIPERELVAYGFVTMMEAMNLNIGDRGEIYSHSLTWQGVSKPILQRRVR